MSRPAARASNAGQYFVSISNSAGTVSTGAVVVVQPRPQMIEFDVPISPRYGDPPFAIHERSDGPEAVQVHVTGVAALLGAPGSYSLEYRGGGWVNVEASAAGDEDVAEATVTRSFFVNPGEPTFSFTPPKDPKYGDPPFPIVATANSGSPDRIEVLGAALLSTASGRAEMVYVRPGPVTVRIVHDGDSNFEAGFRDFPLQVGKGEHHVDFPPIANRLLGPEPLTVTATSSASLPVLLECTDGPASFVAPNQLAIHGDGVVVLKATSAGGDNYQDAAPVFVSFRVYANDRLRLGLQRTASPGGLEMIIRGPPYARLVVQATKDLVIWSDVATVEIDPNLREARRSELAMEAAQAYRLRLAE